MRAHHQYRRVRVIHRGCQFCLIQIPFQDDPHPFAVCLSDSRESSVLCRAGSAPSDRDPTQPRRPAVLPSCERQNPMLARHSLLVGGYAREYSMYTPPCAPASALLHFHGFGQDIDNTALGWKRLADRHCLLIVLPIGVEEDGLAASFNAAGCSSGSSSWCLDTSPSLCAGEGCRRCEQTSSESASRTLRQNAPSAPCRWCSCADDTGFIETIIDRVIRERFGRKVALYATGWSNGGMLVYDLACGRLASRFDAFVSAGGLPQQGWSCNSNCTVSTPFLTIHGRDDATVPMSGRSLTSSWHFQPLSYALAELLARRGCAGASTLLPNGGSNYSLGDSLSLDGGGGAAVRCHRHGTGCKAEVVACVGTFAHDWLRLHVTLAWRFLVGTARRENARATSIERPPSLTV